MRSVRGEGKWFEDKFSIWSGRMYRELGVLFWKRLPSWIGEGSVRPLGYEAVEELDAKRVNEVLEGIGMGRQWGKCMCILNLSAN